MAWHCLQQSTRWRVEQWRSRRPPLFVHARSIIGASGEDGIAVGAAVNGGKVLVMVCIGNNGMELVAIPSSIFDPTSQEEELEKVAAASRANSETNEAATAIDEQPIAIPVARAAGDSTTRPGGGIADQPPPPGGVRETRQNDSTGAGGGSAAASNAAQPGGNGGR